MNRNLESALNMDIAVGGWEIFSSADTRDTGPISL